MDRMDFASIVPKVKVWETKLLNKSFYDKLIECNALEEALKSLQDALNDDMIGEDNFESALASSYEAACNELYETIKHKEIIDFVRLKNDYNNIKTLVKSKILNKDFSCILSKNGTVDLETLKLYFKNDNYGDMNFFMKECIVKSLEKYENTKDVQSIDIVVDSYMYKHYKEIVNKMESSFMNNYIEMVIDLTNLKTTLRVKKLNKDKSFLKEVLLNGGKLSLDVFLDVINVSVEDIPNKFARTSYDVLVADSISEYIKTNSLSGLEKNIDNYIMKFVRDAKYISFGVEPIFAYLYAREVEIKNLRLILAGKVNKVNSNIIKERLRDNYV